MKTHPDQVHSPHELVPHFYHINSPTITDKKLLRERKIISLDTTTGGYEEFLVVDMVPASQENLYIDYRGEARIHECNVAPEYAGNEKLRGHQLADVIGNELTS